MVTAVAIVALGALTVWRWRSGTAPEPLAGVVGPEAEEGARRSPRRWALPAALAGAIVAFELYCYLSLPRAQHPTLSTIIDLLDSSVPGKMAGFALWLALGWFLAAR